MQNGWETGKNKGNPYPELPLYLILYIVAAKNTAIILAELLNQKPTARICQTEKTGKSDFT